MITLPRIHESPAPAPAARPQPGVNSLLASTPFGFVISGAPSGGQSFAHPWKPAIVGRTGVRLAKGIIFDDATGFAFEPVITEAGKTAPISGDAVKKLAQPTLRLDRAVATKQLESWVCVEVTPAADGTLADKTGALAQGAKVEVVHRNAPGLIGETIGRFPLALIVWSANGPARIHPSQQFNLRYRRIPAVPGKSPVQHFFF